MNAIITNKKVDKTFEKEDCLLKRTIVRIIKEKGLKKFIVLTERCNYYTEQHPTFDEETGEQIFDENNNPVLEEITILKSLGKKDKESIFVMSFQEINEFYESVKSQIPDSLSKIDKENLEEQIALLILTKQDKPWGTVETDWELLN